MALVSRASFFLLILLFLWRMPSVWVGGFGAALVALVVASEAGNPVAIACAAVVVTATVVVSLAIDRRRGVSRRMLLRSQRVSPRRVAALVVTLVIIASITTVIAANFMAGIRQRDADELRTFGRPSQKRGEY